MKSAAAPGLEFVDNTAENRYELYLGGERIGLADYALRDATMVIPHTEIDPRHGGCGFGSQMVRRALDDIRARGLRVVPACPFVAHVIARNPAYADLL